MKEPLAILILALAGCGHSAPPAATAIEVILTATPDRPVPPPPVRSTDPAAIASFLAAIEPSREIGNHACASTADVIIERVDGSKTILRLVPAHEAGFQDFRRDRKMFQVPRERFLAALKGLGASEEP